MTILPVGSTAISDPATGNQLKPNADGSLNIGSGGGGGTQYVDGGTPPANPVGPAIVFDNSGTWVDVGVDHPLPVAATVTPPANQRVNAQAADFLTGSIVDLATLLTLSGTPTDANTVNSYMGRLTKIRDLLNATLTVQGTITEANSAAILAKIVASPALEGGHLATIDTSTAALNTLAGTSGDANTIASLMGRLTKIRDLLNTTLGVQQTDLSAGPTTISAAQPSINTPVSNATVSLTLGQGQSSWLAQITAVAGFTSASTIAVDQSIDGGTTWFATNFKVAGSLTNTPVQSVVGPGPLLISGDAASKGILRVRCSVLGGGETMSVLIKGGAGIGSVGLLSSIPTGTNAIGSVSVSNANANGQNTMANSAPVTFASDQSAIQTKQGTWTQIYSTTQTTVTSWAGSGDITLNAAYTYFMINIHISAITSGSIQFFINRKDSFGNYAGVTSGSALTTAVSQIFTIGPGSSTNHALGSIMSITTGVSSLVGCTFTLEVLAR